MLALCLFVVFISAPLVAASTPLTVMPMGDSITEGVDYCTLSAGGYRTALYSDLTAAGVSFQFVGVSTNNPSATLTAAGQVNHNGYGGWRIQDMNNNLDGVAAPIGGGDSNQGGYFLTGGHGTGRAAVTPDVILLHIGTNDLLQGSTTINQDLYNLVTHIHALTPNTTILIASVIPINAAGFTAAVNSYNSYISTVLVPSLSYTRYVDQHSSFLHADGSIDSGLLGSDLVHPTQFGYPLIAQNWTSALEILEGITATTHALTVSNGTGSGSYPAGAIVTLEAQTSTSNNQFGWWSPATTALSNPYSSYALYTMPNTAASISAVNVTSGSVAIPNGTYRILSQYSGLALAATSSTNGATAVQLSSAETNTQKWDLVNLGSNVVSLMLTGTNLALEVPFSNANTIGAALDLATYQGATNQQWTVNTVNGATVLENVASGEAIIVAGYSLASGAVIQQFTPGLIIDKWAFYPVTQQATTYALTVNNGSGSGSYAAGTSVSVTANAPAAGYAFAGWSGSTGSLADPSAATTTLVMPSTATSITATYTLATYALTVTNGSGSGSYTAGTVVTITANAAASGYQFSAWTGTTSALASSSSATTVLTMPAAATAVTATYTQTLLTSSAPTTSASIVSVQFVGGGAAPLHSSWFDYTAGAGSYAAKHWNPVLATGNTITPQTLTVNSGLVDSTGASSNIGFTLAADGAYYTAAGTGFTTSPLYPGYASTLSGPGDAFLFEGFAYTGFSSSVPVTLTVNGLDATHNYSLLAYVTPFEGFGDAQTATVALGSGSSYSLTTTGKLGVYKKATSLTPTNAATANYVQFDNLSGATSQKLTLSGSTMVGFSGFQVVDNGATGSSTTTTPVSEALTVVSGTGSGSYAVGSSVTITANAAASGYSFSGWTGDTAILTNASAATTTAVIASRASTLTATYTALSTVSGVSNSAPASQIVSVQFVGGGAAPLHSSWFDYTAGAGSYSAAHWNALLATGNTQTAQTLSVSSGLTDSTGASTTYGFTLQSSGAYYTGAGTKFTGSPAYPGYTGVLSGAGDAFLYAGFAYAGFSNNSPITLTVAGLNTTHTYNLLVYVTPFENFGDGQAATVALNGGSTYYVKAAGLQSSYQRASSTAAASPATGNYVEFDGLTGSAAQTITFTNTSQLVGISGFQIVDVTSSNNSTTASAAIVNSSTVPAGYHLTFDDEFASLSISDVSGASTKWFSNTIQCCLYDTSNPTTPTYMAGVTSPAGQNPFSLIAGGGLDIRLQKTSGAWYSGVLATVDSNGKGFAQKYGYFEMKAKFPSGAGTWPAFWLQNQAALASGAYAGEIDIAEAYMAYPNYVNSTLHDWTPPASTLMQNTAQVADLSSGYHIFGLLWTASTMTFYCDGVTLLTTATPSIMQQAYYPIIDLGLGGGWPTSTTPQSSDMLVQYVRVYAAN